MTEKEKMKSIVAELEVTCAIIETKLKQINIPHPKLEEALALFKNEIIRYKKMVEELF